MGLGYIGYLIALELAQRGGKALLKRALRKARRKLRRKRRKRGKRAG